MQRRVVQRKGGSAGTVQSLQLGLLGDSQDLQSASLQAVPKDWHRVALGSELGTVGAGGVPLWEKPQD